MTYEFEYLMNLLAASAKGTPVQKPINKVEWNKLFKLADEQSIKPLIAYALKNSDIDCPAQYRLFLLNSLRNTVIDAIMRKNKIINLLEEFEKNNIKAVVLKGFEVAECYAVPECRISGDTDIYINIVDEKKAYNILKKNDFIIEHRKPRSHHAKCHHPQMGYIELHVSLYSKIHSEIKYKDISEKDLIKEPYIKILSESGTYYSLGKTDNFIFLTLHMIKHFIDSGTNLRMFMDIIMFYKANKKDIDINRFWSIIDCLNYRKLISTVIYSMEIFCNFKKEEIPIIDEVMQENISNILNDLEINRGINYIDESRIDSRNMYNREKLLVYNNVFQYKYFIIKRFIIKCYYALFPSKQRLMTLYPRIKNPLLIPWIWVHYIIFYGLFRILNKKIKINIINENSELSERGMQRVEMFRKLGIM